MTLIETSVSKTNLLVPSPIFLTTVSSSGKPNICTISYYSTIHFEPPTIAISLHKNHQSTTNLIKTKKFCMNVPGKGMADLAMQVGGVSGSDIDKFSKFNIDADIKSGWPPHLKNSVLCLFGSISEKLDYSEDRVLFLGQIEKALMSDLLEVGDRNPEYIWKLFQNNVLSHSEIYISKEEQ